jgi:GTP-binding protein HflX
VVVADQLFATLDPTVRRLRIPGGREVTLSDTVGFVSKLPHDLVEAFRSTLEEVARASVILHVADGAARDLDSQVTAVREVLAEIGAARIPEVLALNKSDLLSEVERARLERRFPGAILVSALEGEGLEALLTPVDEAIPSPPVEVRLRVPYDRQEVVARLHREAEVLRADPKEEGTLVEARVREDQLRWVEPFLAAPVSTRARPSA